MLYTIIIMVIFGLGIITYLLAVVWGIHWWPVNSPHKGPVTRKMFPFDDAIMIMVIIGLYNTRE